MFSQQKIDLITTWKSPNLFKHLGHFPEDKLLTAQTPKTAKKKTKTEGTKEIQQNEP